MGREGCARKFLCSKLAQERRREHGALGSLGFSAHPQRSGAALGSHRRPLTQPPLPPPAFRAGLVGWLVFAFNSRKPPVVGKRVICNPGRRGGAQPCEVRPIHKVRGASGSGSREAGPSALQGLHPSSCLCAQLPLGVVEGRDYASREFFTRSPGGTV